MFHMRHVAQHLEAYACIEHDQLHIVHDAGMLQWHGTLLPVNVQMNIVIAQLASCAKLDAVSHLNCDTYQLNQLLHLTSLAANGICRYQNSRCLMLGAPGMNCYLWNVEAEVAYLA